MDSNEPVENWRVFGFCEAGVDRLHDTPVSPRSESKDTEGERVKLADDDDDILTLNVDCGSFGEEMECEAEDQAEQDADKVRISDPGQPSKREREEREATHAQYRSWCIACVRGRRVAMKHFRNTFADEERLHTFVMDYCSPSQGSQQGITVLVI